MPIRLISFHTFPVHDFTLRILRDTELTIAFPLQCVLLCSHAVLRIAIQSLCLSKLNVTIPCLCLAIRFNATFFLRHAYNTSPERFNAILYNTFALPGLLLCAIAVVCSPLPSRSHASPLPCFPPRSYATACLICSFASLIQSVLS